MKNGAVALTVAALVSACFLLTGKEAPLPACWWAAVFLFLAVERDVRERRIPNWLTMPAFGLSVVHAAWVGGLGGTGASLLGAGVALGILVFPYAVGWFGAGDVKAMMVLGALWGTGVVVSVITWAVLLGGVLALGWVAIRGGLPDLVGRVSSSLYVSAVSRKWTYAAPSPGTAAAGGIPFAVAIALGVSAYQQLGSPWA